MGILLLVPRPHRSPLPVVDPSSLAITATYRTHWRCRTFSSTLLSMERIGVRELNQNTSQVLARVSGGETLEITDRGRPIARLVPVGDDRSMLAKLVAAGRAVAPTGGGPVPPPPKLGDEDVDVAAALTAMRDEERW